jgi:hypothetical protein
VLLAQIGSDHVVAVNHRVDRFAAGFGTLPSFATHSLKYD